MLQCVQIIACVRIFKYGEFLSVIFSEYTSSFLGIRPQVLQNILCLKPEVSEIRLPEADPYVYKNEIPIQASYRHALPHSYWKHFPFNDFPGGVQYSRSINAYKYHEIMIRAFNMGFLRGVIQESEVIPNNFMSPLLKTVLVNLFTGVNLHIDKQKLRKLNNCVDEKNVILESANSLQLECSLEGSIFADYLCTGLKKGIFLGPFSRPLKTIPIYDAKGKTVKDFEVNLTIFNKLFIINQHDKYRIISDLSTPSDKSINDCINSRELRKLQMSTIPQIFRRVRQIGPSCLLSKVDLQSAYQQLPLRSGDIPLHAFKFAEKIFYNQKMVFGERSSPELFDNFNKMNTELAIFQSSYNPENVFRVLDDTVITDKYCYDHKHFVKTLVNFCSETNIVLAEFKENKAFVLRPEGEVLGILIHCPTLSWTLRKGKRDRMLFCLVNLYKSKFVSLLDLQTLLGLINVIVLLTPPLRFYKDFLIRDLTRAIEAEAKGDLTIKLSEQARDQIRIWINTVNALSDYFPIHDIHMFPSDNTTIISTDAAGNQMSDLSRNIGAGVVWYKYNHHTGITETIISQAFFVKSFVTTQRDEFNNKRFGSKTSVLEALGIMLAFYHFLPLFKGQSLIIDCDNEGLVWAWRQGRSKTCQYLSQLIAAMNYSAVMFSVNVYFRHVRRKTTPASIMADHLTRDDEKAQAILRLTKPHNIHFGFPPILIDWMMYPTIYNNFAFEFHDSIKL